MNIGLVSTWFEKGAAYVTKAYADFLIKNGHNVFIYARGGTMAQDKTKPWCDYQVTYQDKSVRDFLIEGVQFSDHTAKQEEFWNRYYEGKTEFVKDISGTKIDTQLFLIWALDNKLDVVFFNEQKDDTEIQVIREQGIKAVYFGTDPSPLSPSFYEEAYDKVIWHTGVNEDTMPCKNGCRIQWGVDPSSMIPKMCNLNPDSYGVRFFHNAGTGFNNARKGTDRTVIAWSKLCFGMNKNTSKFIIHSILPLHKMVNKKAIGVYEEIMRNSSFSVVVGRESVPGFYFMGNVYVYPAMKDGIGLTMYEAMAHGMPLIVPNAKPFNEHVVDGVNGFVLDKIKLSDEPWSPVHQLDGQELAEKMAIYVDEPKLVKKHGHKSLEFLRENFNFDKNHTLLLEMLEELKG